ncbi:hypothetical protein BCT61_05420 [Vibrio breoganii]|uniref:restriction endonuclease subunit S n=1 Tax=Vibrio breoganii TaxID=553239 RepID=UPI000CADB39C|nr:restriction endonuclease subunit S [Vibrio breoganii]PMM12462.1 hypothetical protein BCT61_05420 [Vibrio breoganii]
MSEVKNDLNIELNNLDKSNWKTYRFDEIAKNISERIDPNNTDLKVYVGLEHIDSESLHIKRHGTPDDVNGQKLKFYKGDIIFGRRRAYQRKAGIATWDGFCSAHALVLRANPDVIDPALFPFFMHSDLFMNRAIDISVGSLSPTINWGTLKHQEFLIPPIEMQKGLTDLFTSLDGSIQHNKSVNSKYEILYQKFMFDSVSGANSSEFKTWKEHKFGDLGESFGGLTGKTKKDFGIGKPFITYMNVFSNNKVDKEQVELVDIKEGERQHKVKYGDILITGSSEIPKELGMAAVVLENLDEYYLNSFCFGFRLHDFNTLIPEYARYLMHGQIVRNFMFKHAQGSTRFNLSKTTLKERLVFKLPSINEQKEISDKLTGMLDRKKAFKNKIRSLLILQNKLINKVF